jgi:hypothetical protein
LDTKALNFLVASALLLPSFYGDVSADYSDAQNAFNDRDCGSSLNQFIPLAEAGDSVSQHYLGEMY